MTLKEKIQRISEEAEIKQRELLAVAEKLERENIFLKGKIEGTKQKKNKVK